MYCTNVDMGGNPTAPRGDGAYRPVLARGDGHMLYLMALSTALDGDWIFNDELRDFGDPWHERLTETGRKAIVHPIGTALVWTPLLWVAQAGAIIGNAFGANIPLHGYTAWHQRFVFLSSVLFACGSVLLGLVIAYRRCGGKWSAAYATAAILLASPLTYYATYMPSYSHAIDAFACAAFLAYWAHTLRAQRPRRWIILGILLGFAALIRTQELAMGIVVALEVSVEVIRSLRTREFRKAFLWLLGGLGTLAVALIVLIPQFIEWHLVFGSGFDLPQSSRYVRFEAPMILELLYAARNGWFSTHPLAYVSVIGLFLFPREWRLLGIGLALAVATQVYLNSIIL